MVTRHLDLGCGPTPRNPYGRDEAHGIDIAVPAGLDGRFFRRANLAVEPIPHPDSSLDSVSAFDFFEHVPRLLATPDGRGTRFPFVELDRCVDDETRLRRHGEAPAASVQRMANQVEFRRPQ